MTDEGDPRVRRPPASASDAEQQGMSRLRRALTRRREHAEHAAGWRDIDKRNHFGPSIEAAMRAGLERKDGV